MKPSVAVCTIAIVALLLTPPTSAQLSDDPFPSHDEVVARLAAAASAAPDWIRLESIGNTTNGAALQMAVITDPDQDGTPLAERVVTLLLTQQHGSEPAGTPAALDLVDAIAAGDAGLRGTLHNQVLLVAPMGNPDGAAAGARENAVGSDLNRDHVHLHEPETVAVHALLNRWDVHVGVDHHEYSGQGTGYPNPVRTYDYDITTLFPRHGNVRAPTLVAAEALMYDGMWPAAAAAGYSINEYGEQTAAGVPIGHAAGGPDPGILRNNFGLQNIAGILVESYVPFGVPNPFVDAERRTDVHRVIMDATLEFASEHAADLIGAKRESERLNREEPMAEYVEAWPADPVTGEPGPERRGALAAAYQTTDDLDDLMARHGLPAAAATGEVFLYTLDNHRAGLLAAILHPQSSRQVPESVAALQPEPTIGQPADGDAGEANTPMAGVTVACLLLVGVAAERRSRAERARQH